MVEMEGIGDAEEVMCRIDMKDPFVAIRSLLIAGGKPW
jgi:hypothetical protein